MGERLRTMNPKRWNSSRLETRETTKNGGKEERERKLISWMKDAGKRENGRERKRCFVARSPEASGKKFPSLPFPPFFFASAAFFPIYLSYPQRTASSTASPSPNEGRKKIFFASLLFFPPLEILVARAAAAAAAAAAMQDRSRKMTMKRRRRNNRKPETLRSPPSSFLPSIVK